MDELDLGSTVKGYIPGQKVFGRYTLIRILGRGGMGVVWLAKDAELDREIALKFLPEVVSSDRAAVDDMKREVRRAIDLAHPHIVKIQNFETDGRTAAVSMEYVQGDTLSSLRIDQPDRVFTAAGLARWLAQTCGALDYAHQTGQVVHRDLKPVNLMVNARGDVKILDFGIAASLSESVTRVSKQAGSSGTPVYMSPQQMMGEKPAITDDIYALGATLYELLTGKPPFYAGNILLQVQSKVPPSLTERRAELGVTAEPLPPEWESVIAACLAKEPKERPQSAGEVAERLRLTMDRGRRSEDRGQKPEDKHGAHRPDEPRKADVPSVAAPKRKPATFMPMVIAAVFGLGGLGWYFGIYASEQKRLAEKARLEMERIATERQRIKVEQEKAAAAEKENQDRQEKAAAETKAKVEEEPKIYTDIVAKIDAFVDGSPATLRASTDAAVKTYLAGAPTRFRTEIETRWKDRQAGWEAALEKEKQRLAADRLANARGGIVVRTNPPGAEVRIGAIALDKSPLTLKDQKLGRYPVRVRLDGYEEWTGEVEVKENEFTDLTVTLTKTAGALDTRVSGVLNRMARDSNLTNASIGNYADELVQLGIPTEKQAQLIRILTEFSRDQNLTRTSIEGYTRRVVALASPSVSQAAAYPQPGQRWENSLGQKFVPVPGTDVLFSIWETREQDYAAFASATGRAWQNANAGSTHPAVNVSWDDAMAFCAWLTEKERRERWLAPNQSYRLPTDAEWSMAVGLREGDGTPQTKSGAIKGEYPWGSQWPPPHGAGNYGPGQNVDSYERTAPVGSFPANSYGIHDLGGNVMEWCEDLYDNDKDRVRRGASYQFSNDNVYPLSSYRMPMRGGGGRGKESDTGFRVVVAVESESSSNTASNSSPDSANKPVVGQKWTIPDLQLDLMPIAPGAFQMGSASGGNRDERPVTLVTLTRPFWLGKTEVTQSQWIAVMGNNPSYLKRDNLPVENVSWTEAMAFCRKLTDRERAAGGLPEGYAYTLPTEAQWEYACRAGTTGDYAGNLDSMGWYNGNANGSTKPVGAKQANAWGLHDMHGNVYEWCLDWYGNYPGESVTDPTGPPSGTSRVGRGGSMGNFAGSCRSAVRSWFGPDNRVNFLGFRLALAASR
jgi:formylglycine-generating enzyme required for sulfatase activity